MNKETIEVLKVEVRLAKAQRNGARSEVVLLEEECRRLARLAKVEYRSLEELVAERSRKSAADVIRRVAQKFKP